MTELDALLETASGHGYRWHLFRTDRHGADALVGVRRHSCCADVFVLSDEEHAHAYRVPNGADIDVFAPVRVYWWYRASPVWTLRALLTLSPPDHPAAPAVLVQAPPGAGVPGGWIPARV